MILGMDLKITNKCFIGCPFCHEDSKKDGLHADLNFIKNIIEVNNPLWAAIGGGDVLVYPEDDLYNLLMYLLQKNIQIGVTINSKSVIKYKDRFRDLYKYLTIDFMSYRSERKVRTKVRKVWFGISVSDVKDLFPLFEIVTNISLDYGSVFYDMRNIIFHFINKVHSSLNIYQVAKYFNTIASGVLILGYKDFGRGLTFNKKEEDIIKAYNISNIVKFLKENKMTLAFDTLALKQLPFLKNKYSPFYLWEDGEKTVYVDAVSKTYARNSYSIERYNLDESNPVVNMEVFNG